MYTLTEGKVELLKAFKIYYCKFCGYEGLKADDLAIANGKESSDTIRYREDLYEGPEVKNFMGFEKFECPICAMGMTQKRFPHASEYVEYLIGKKVPIKLPQGGTEEYALKEEDLYLRRR